MAQFARPDGNITQTSFTGGFAEIDEAVASDADFAYGANNTAAALEVSLTNVGDPGLSTGHIFRYRIAKTNNGAVDGGGNSLTVTARLLQGATQIAADTARTPTGTWATYSYTLTGTEADSITDYNDLRLEFVTTATGGGPSVRRGGAISWAELEVPSLDKSGTASTSHTSATSATGTKYVPPTQTSVAVVSLASVTDPGVSTDHSIVVRARVQSGAATAVLRAALYEGASNRSGDLSSSPLTTSLADYTLPINSGNAANITDYSNLELRFWGVNPEGTSITFEVDYIALRLPEAESADFSGTASVTHSSATTATGSKSRSQAVTDSKSATVAVTARKDALSAVTPVHVSSTTATGSVTIAKSGSATTSHGSAATGSGYKASAGTHASTLASSTVVAGGRAAVDVALAVHVSAAIVAGRADRLGASTLQSFASALLVAAARASSGTASDSKTHAVSTTGAKGYSSAAVVSHEGATSALGERAASGSTDTAIGAAVSLVANKSVLGSAVSISAVSASSAMGTASAATEGAASAAHSHLVAVSGIKGASAGTSATYVASVLATGGLDASGATSLNAASSTDASGRAAFLGSVSTGNAHSIALELISGRAGSLSDSVLSAITLASVAARAGSATGIAGTSATSAQGVASAAGEGAAQAAHSSLVVVSGVKGVSGSASASVASLVSPEARKSATDIVLVAHSAGQVISGRSAKLGSISIIQTFSTAAEGVAAEQTASSASVIVSSLVVAGGTRSAAGSVQVSHSATPSFGVYSTREGSAILSLIVSAVAVAIKGQVQVPTKAVVVLTPTAYAHVGQAKKVPVEFVQTPTAPTVRDKRPRADVG